MTAAIAAYRAGNAPHILQVFEVGTATMMAAKGAIVPVGKVMAMLVSGSTRRLYMPALLVTTRRQRPDAELPVQQLDDRLPLQQGRFQGRRPDPEKPPKTWIEVAQAA